MDLTPRQEQILQLIVKLYGETEEPIGSRTLLQKSVLNVSPATIRNDMVALEQLGYLMKAHSSSGRIPSFEGYRFYINQLIQHFNEERESSHALIAPMMKERFYDIQELVNYATERLSKLTGYTTVAYVTNEKFRRMRDFKLSKVSDTQVIASIITDHNRVESQLFQTPQPLDESAIHKIEAMVQDELCDLTLAEIYPRMQLTFPLRIQQAVSMQLNFAPLIKQALDAYDASDYYAVGKNHLFDIIDTQMPIQAWKNLFDLLDGNEDWFKFLANAKKGLDVIFDFQYAPYHYKNLSIITAKIKIGSHLVSFGLIGPATMSYPVVIQHMNQLLVELSRY
ncbi:heat-inducible transcription repressor HrcA [Tuanshanicoccus lijuaniae]|uniref:heat-inducible transcriptional repressor HrcA n=1 Tax=Aerococcaceae bacterium zg-1292 TaxID=2774330 RepID=UPI001936FBF8|nr:heat-inducible transcription repressor HrcA [Aerococcaceae bacterium zg-1292]QQA36367.1 heat-inducible transcription repressor HrcA [Aerococcaceae bacterium zg-1292]